MSRSAMTRSAMSYLKRQFEKNLLRDASARRRMHTVRREDALSVSVADMRRQLRLNGYPVDDGFACLATRCPACGDGGRAYVNKTTGFFLCSECHRSGRWDAFEKFITDKCTADDAFDEASDKFAAARSRLVENTVPLTRVEDDRLREYLVEKDLPPFPQVLKAMTDVRMSPDGKSLYFPLQNASNKIVGYVNVESGRAIDATEPAFGCGGVSWFKSVRFHSKEHPAIIVPTVGDALAVAAQKLPGGVACLPYGLNYLPQEVLPVLEKCPKLILWADSDGAPQARAFARKLGETRCMLIRATESQPSAREALRGNLDIRGIVASARPVWHKSITTFKSLRDDVYSDLCNVEEVRGIKWQRFPTLNKLLHGHRRGELTVLTGPTGCGKTTFCSEYSLDLAERGVNTLWGSFEIRNARLARTMLQQLAGFPLEENLDEFDKYADAFQTLPLYFLTFHGQQTIKDVMEAVEHASYVYDIAHVIVDNVQFMLGVGDEVSKHSDRFWKQDAVIGAFRSFATRRDCHVTLVMHPRKERDADDLSSNSIFGSAKASQEADNVLIIQDKRLTAIRGKKYLQIAKNRFSGDLGVMPLEFDKSGLSYGVKKSKKE